MPDSLTCSKGDILHYRVITRAFYTDTKTGGAIINRYFLHWIIIALFVGMIVPGVVAQSDDVITVDNASELVPAYFLPGCEDISTDSRYVGDRTGVYDLSTGEVILPAFQNDGNQTRFSPDMSRVVLSRQGMYDLNTLDLLFELPYEMYGPGSEISFSPDSSLVIVNGLVYSEDGEVLYELASIGQDHPMPGIFSSDGQLLATRNWVYDSATLQHVFGVPEGDSNYVSFSSDGTLLLVGHVGVYDTETWELLFPVTGLAGEFSPDGQMVSIVQDGVYDTATGAYLTGRYGTFSPDSQLLIVSGDGVYDTATWERLYTLPGSYFSSVSFTGDGSLMLVGNHGIFDVMPGEMLLDLSAFARNDHRAPIMRFSPDDSFVYVHNPYGNSSTIGCHIYSLADRQWADPQFGVVETYGAVNIRREPGGPVMATGDGVLVVLAQTDDGWFRTPIRDGMGWVGASAVNVLSDITSLPVEQP